MPHDLPGLYSWDQARKAAKDIAFGGRTDWRLPTKGELEQLYRVRDILGPFNWDFYWSSTENTPDFAWYQSFKTGTTPTPRMWILRFAAFAAKPPIDSPLHTQGAFLWAKLLGQTSRP
jgi:hypothetical protein